MKKLYILMLIGLVLFSGLASAAWTDSLSTDLKLYFNCSAANDAVSGAVSLGADKGSIAYNTTRALVGDACQVNTDNTFILDDDVTNMEEVGSGGGRTTNFWFRTFDSSASYQQIYGTKINSYPQGYISDAGHEIFTFKNYVTPSGTTTVAGVTDNTYHMISLVNNGTGLLIYMDANFIIYEQPYADWDNSSMVFGTALNGIYGIVDGQFDELGFWDRGLSSTEITQLYNGGAGITYAAIPKPTVTLNSPANDSNYTIGSVLFNSTVTPKVFESTNATIYIWHSNGTLYNSTTNLITGSSANITTFNISMSTIQDNYIWNVRGCQGNGIGDNCSFATTNQTVNIKILTNESQSYTASVIEQTSQTFRYNFSLSTGYSVSSVKLVYNLTNYTASFESLGSGSYQATATLTVPAVDANTNLSFYWNTLLTNGDPYLSSSNNQTVNNFGIDACVLNTMMIFNFTMYDEELQTWINNVTYNTSVKIDLNLYSSATATTPVFEYSHHYSQNATATVCINSSLSSSNYYVDALIEYDADNYVKEFYNLQRYNLNATSNPSQNISLYDLNESDSQVFTVSYKDSSFAPVEGALIQVQRTYIDEGSVKTVEVPKTDVDGEALVHLVPNDVIYTFTVVKNGVVLATFNDKRAVCQNPSIEDCRIDLNSFETDIVVTNFATYNDFSYTLTYNDATRTITTAFSIPSGGVSTIVLNVTKEDALGTAVCSETVTTSAGTLNCIVANSFGNSTVFAEVYKDGVLVASGHINMEQSPSDIYGASLVFIAMVLLLTIVGASISDNPVFTIIFLLVGVILLFALNLIDSTGFIGGSATILWLVMAIIIIIVKAARRN